MQDTDISIGDKEGNNALQQVVSATIESSQLCGHILLTYLKLNTD